MANLWGGRFTRQTDELVNDFNASISFDKRLYREDITGSMAHAAMLGETKVLTKGESEEIINALNTMLRDIDEGRLAITDDYEDIHSFVEAKLIERIGDTGKKLHTGRSRNDQVALDMKLYTRRTIADTDALLYELLRVLEKIIVSGTETVMPGFTHLQKAQPLTLAHHISAYFEMFRRDRERLIDTFERMNYSPLGSGALAGTTYPLDREMVAKELKFKGATANSMDSVSDRDYLIEYLSDLSLIMMHLSRFSEEIIIWNSDEYRFIELDDTYSTGSSIMPQKKNPDIAELVRGKTGRVYGALVSLLTTMKALPLAYDKDMQEDKEVAFDSIDTVQNCIRLFTGMLDATRFNEEMMRFSASGGFTNATDAADYLVRKGVPFRDAHGIIGRLVLYCIDNKKTIDDCTLDELKSIDENFDEDIYGEISLKTCVDRRVTKGAPGEKAMKEYLSDIRNYMEKNTPISIQEIKLISGGN